MSNQDKPKGSSSDRHPLEQQRSLNSNGQNIDDEFIKKLSSSLKNFSLYPAEHPACSSSLMELLSLTDFILEKRGRLILGAIGNELVVDGKPFLEKSPVYTGLAELLHRKKVDKVVISKGITLKELKEFIVVLSGDSGQGHSHFNEILESHGVKNIRAGTIESTRFKVRTQANAKDLEEAEKDYQESMEISREINETVRAGQDIKLGEVNMLAKLLVRGIMENRASLMTILNIHSKDDYLTTHSIDVAMLTLLQVERFNLGENLLRDIACAAILHDLGKLRVPVEILNKAGGLTVEEWEIIKKHPVWGAEKNRLIKDISDLAVIVSFEHHIRYDRKGYPECLSSKPITTLSLMVAIADAYDAMRSRRSYQEELVPEEAAAGLLKSSGSSLHPVMIQKFLDRVGIFGLGTLVELSTNDVGLVVENNKGDPYHPTVRIIADQGGQPVRGKVINTSITEGKEIRVTVEKSLEPDEKYRNIILS